MDIQQQLYSNAVRVGGVGVANVPHTPSPTLRTRTPPNDENERTCLPAS